MGSNWEEIMPWETAESIQAGGKDPLKEKIKKTAREKKQKDEKAWADALKKAQQNS